MCQWTRLEMFLSFFIVCGHTMEVCVQRWVWVHMYMCCMLTYVCMHLEGRSYEGFVLWLLSSLSLEWHLSNNIDFSHLFYLSNQWAPLIVLESTNFWFLQWAGSREGIWKGTMLKFLLRQDHAFSYIQTSHGHISKCVLDHSLKNSNACNEKFPFFGDFLMFSESFTSLNFHALLVL